LQSKGEITPPWGVPLAGRRSAPSSITPARKKACSSARTLRSQMRSESADSNRSCGIAVKQLLMSVSTTHRWPPKDSSMTTCRASWADQLGRNPKLHASMSASKISSSTIFRAACTTRSRIAEIDSGLSSSRPGFGMYTRRAGSGRNRLSRSSASSSLSSTQMRREVVAVGDGARFSRLDGGATPTFQPCDTDRPCAHRCDSLQDTSLAFSKNPLAGLNSLLLRRNKCCVLSAEDFA
jgi:hypothetical protein